MTWLLAIPARLRAALAGVVALLALLVGAYAKGRSDAAQRAKNEGLEDYRDDRRRIDDAKDFGDDADAAADWLRDRADKRGL